LSIDPVETLGDVCIQDVLGEFVDAEMDGSNRIMAGATGAEAIATWFKLGFPLWLQGKPYQGLQCSIIQSCNPQRPFFIGAPFGDPNPPNWLGFCIKFQLLYQFQAFGWG
jgi:hypothetical protein